MNLANVATYTLTGTCSEPGQVVTVTVAGVAPETPTCTGGNTWATAAFDVSAAADGPALSITADHSDLAGNPAVQASTTVGKDTIAPTVTINAPTHISNATISNTTIQVTDNNGITNTNVAIDGATTAGTANFVCNQTSPVQVDCTIDITSDGALTIDATDDVGNPAIPVTESGYEIDPFSPNISINAPTHLSTTTISDTHIQVVDNDILVAGVSVSGTATPTNLVCTQTLPTQVDCSVDITTSGTLLVDATDAASNAAPQASESGYVIDAIAPVVSITPVTYVSSTAITDTTIQVTDNNGITNTNVFVNGITTAGYANLVCNQTSAVQVDCTIDITSSGALTIDAIDDAGNSAAPPITQGGYVIDAVPPVISAINAPTLLSNATISDTTIQVTDDQGITNTNVSVSGSATPTNLVCLQTTPTQVDCTVDITTSGTLLVDATDNAGNPAVQASQAGYVITSVGPTAALSSAATDPTNASPFSVTATFSANVHDFTLSGISVTNGTAFNFVTSTPDSVYTFDVTPAGEGAVLVDIAASSSLDIIGNGNSAAPQLSRTYDITAPSTPVASPVAGTYSSAQSVTLTTNDGTATIRYTTTGVAPTCGTGTVYAGAFSVASSMTVEAIACDPATNASGVFSGTYTIQASSGGGGGGGSGSGNSIPLTTHYESTMPGTSSTAPITSTSTAPVTTSTTPVVGPFQDPSNLPSLLSALNIARNIPQEDIVLKQVYADAKEFRLTLTPDQAMAIRNFIVYGISPATIKFGQGERRAIERDYMDTVARPEFVWSDIERMATGQIPVVRNLALERLRVSTVLPVFTRLFGHAPNFKNATENLAWNTLLYRIRFPRDLVKEATGIQKYYAIYRHNPFSPFNWAVVRVLGYVK